MDGLELVIIHLYSLGRDDIPEELDGGSVELALLQLEVKMVFSQFLKDLLHVAAMFSLVLGVDEDIINIDDDELMEELPEHLIHESLED